MTQRGYRRAAADATGNDEPATSRQQRDRDVRDRRKGRHLRRRRQRINRRAVNVAAERYLRACRLDAARGIRCRRDVAETFRAACLCVHVKAVLLGRGQRQAGEEVARRLAEFAPRPLDRDSRLDIHAFARLGHGVVVIAADRAGAVCDQRHGRRHGPFRIGAVADVIAEQNEAPRASGARVVKAGGKGLTVGVDVGEQGDQHGRLRSTGWPQLRGPR